MNKKHLIAVTVVLTSMFGTATAFADTNVNTVSDGNVTVSTTNDTSNGVADNSTTNTGTGSTGDVNNTTTDSNSTGNTTNGTGDNGNSNFPQSYLSFVTQITQSISIALANNDTDKAKLLVQYGIANIKLANELVEEGNVDSASSLLSNAMKYQDSAVDVSQQAGGTTATEVKGEVAGNLAALAAALQHVKNPNAQAQLEKNILKDLEHLQKKIGHIEEHKGHDEDGSVEVSGSTSSTGSTTTTTTGNTTGSSTGTGTASQAGSSSSTTIGAQGSIDLSSFFGNGDKEDHGDHQGDKGDHGNHGDQGNHGDHGNHGGHGDH